jgi:hypothetical protein
MCCRFRRAQWRTLNLEKLKLGGPAVQGSTLIGLMIVLTTVLGYVLGKRKGRPVLGSVLGFVLSYIGLIVILFVPRRYPRPQNLARPLFAARRLFSAGIKSGVIVDRKYVAARYRQERSGEPRVWIPGGTEGSVTVPGHWHHPMMQVLDAPEQLWLKLKRSDGRSGWVQVDKATYQLPDGHYVD